MSAPPNESSGPVAGHYDRLDPFYRQIWGEHIHHGLWTEPGLSPEVAVRRLVHRVARDARMKSGCRVCDVGCGYGAPARIWARTYGADVVGFTVSEVQHAYAQQRSEGKTGPTYRCRDILKNDLPSETFDAVVAIESLTHTDDPARVVHEAARLLRPGGRLVACVWMAAPAVSPGSRAVLLNPICAEGRLSGLPTATTLHRWATRAGLQVCRLSDRTAEVRRTWTHVVHRLGRALWTDPAVARRLLDTSAPDRGFARTVLRIWAAQHLGVLRYGWLVAEQEGGQAVESGR